MRGAYSWTVGDRELRARSSRKPAGGRSDFETSAIEEPLRATLRMLCKLTREHAVEANDIRASWLLVPRANRLRMHLRFVSSSTRSVGWRMPSGSSFRVQKIEAGAKYLLA